MCAARALPPASMLPLWRFASALPRLLCLPFGPIQPAPVPAKSGAQPSACDARPTLAGRAAAEEGGGKPSPELNGLQWNPGVSALTILIGDGLAARIEALLLGAEGTVDQLTLFDLGAVPVA
ncbi:MAG: hypothetical protein AAF913_17080 [Pseudomonadota bacterium]